MLGGSKVGFFHRKSDWICQKLAMLSYIAMLKYDEEDCCVKEEAWCFGVGFLSSGDKGLPDPRF